MTSEPCLVCGTIYWVEGAHWPKAKGLGGRSKEEDEKLPKLPMCYRCHGLQHRGNGDVTETLILKAPDYWRAQGTWDLAQPYLDKFLSRRSYLEAVG